MFTEQEMKEYGLAPNELKHYGVLGMKWGVRRYQNPDGTLTAKGQKHYAETGEYGYHYKSHSTKKYERKASKAESKGKSYKAEIYKRRAQRSKDLDAKEFEYAKSVTAGGNLAVRLLTGGLSFLPGGTGIGGKAYQQHMAMNGGIRKEGAKAVAALWSFILPTTIVSRIRKAAYLRSNERLDVPKYK